MLWLCLHLPLLSLQVFTRGSAVSFPLAVVSGKGKGRVVAAANAEAEAGGICPGMDLGAAHALVPGLRLRERDRRAEERALAGLGNWAGQFTPSLSLTPSGLLLEVAGSLGLFGGLERLAGRVEKGVETLGYHFSAGIAPVPLAAELLARAGGGGRVAEPSCLAEALAPLGLTVLGLPESMVDALQGIGVRSLGDCLGLPRSGLLRRFGQDLVEYLDRALGKLPDPRPPFCPPSRFVSRLELPVEVEHSAGLCFAANRLLLELEGFLRAQGKGAQQLLLRLCHRERGPTSVKVGLAAPGRDAKRLLGLVRERLEQTPLPAAVSALELSVSALTPLRPRALDLFSQEQEGERDGALLVEKLRARLGEEAVQELCLTADHRPEQAFRWTRAGEQELLCALEVRRRKTSGGQEAPAEALGRPLWLLPAPTPFPVGKLSFLSGPERIESGWWDGGDVVRDYYVAEDLHGSRLWIFRERRGERGWFLHGIFG